jgi:hypothetical protein
MDGSSICIIFTYDDGTVILENRAGDRFIRLREESACHKRRKNFC